MYFYKRLKDLREDNDKTQSEIAQLLNIKQQQYGNTEDISGHYDLQEA